MNNGDSPLACDERALVLASRGRDAELARSLLNEAGIAVAVCDGPGMLLSEIERGAALAIVAEEALATADLHPLSAWIEAQPQWSDFPFLLLTGRPLGPERTPLAKRLMDVLGNVAFLERPLHPTTLVSAIRAALRARRRQYQARAYAQERAEAAEHLHQAHARVLAGEQRLRMILESATEYAFVTMDLEGRVTGWNAGARNILGWDEAEIIGQSANLFFTPEDRASGNIEAEMRTALTEGKARDERWHMRKDGSRFWALGMLMPLEDGGIHGFLKILRDRTEERRHEDNLRRAKEEAERAKEEAERANLAKSKFLATASHDLRQPLQSQLLFLEALKPHVTDQPGKTKLLHLGRGLDAMKELLDSLLDISRLEAGTIQPSFESFPLGPLVEQLAESYGPVAQSNNLRLRVDGCDAVVRSDQTLLARMIRNLLENAIRYTRHGEVAVECRREHESLRIVVRDTGIGIPSEHLDRIWEEFHQVGNTERDRNQGLGLELAIVHRLSGLLNHPINVQSTLGQGSAFAISLPLGDAIPVEPPHQDAKADGGGRLAVVVEDDVIVLMSLQTILQEWGYQVMVAGSTDEALDQLRAQGREPDIVISDYRLRGGRFGTEAITEIRRLCGAHLPGILLTGETSPKLAREATALRVALVHKPVTPRQLAMLVEKQIAV